MPSEIERLNPGLRDLVRISRRTVNHANFDWLSRLQPVTFLHFTDIHGSRRAIQRVTELMEAFTGLYDDAVFTGDMVRLRYSTGIDFWRETPGSEKILTCVGNHDTLNAPDKVWDWTDMVSMQTQAETYIEPFIGHWGSGITYTPGTTYYAKRYEAQKVLLLVLCTVIADEDQPAQLAFLKAQLAAAKQDDYAVVIAQHDTPVENEVLPGAWSAYEEKPHPPCGTGVRTEMLRAVQDFIDGGGFFFCYLCGHSHLDFLCRSTEFPDQWFVVAGTSDCYRGNRRSDGFRRLNDKSEDLINFATFDRESHTVKLIRAGYDRDFLLRHRGVLVFDCQKHCVLYSE